MMASPMTLVVNAAVQQATTRAARIDALAPDRREAALAAERYLQHGLHPRHESREAWLATRRAWREAPPRLWVWRRLLAKARG
jgi:hypothetical protein